VVRLEQVGSNVVATGSGAIDLTGLIFQFQVSAVPVLVPNHGQITTGQPGSLADFYTGFTGPTTFGSGSVAFSSSGSGDFVGIVGEAPFGGPPLVIVPGGYVSGVLSDSATYNGATFNSLGVTPGTYVWTWGTGANQNFTLEVGPAAVPDTGSSFALLLVALSGLFSLSRFRRVHLA
jgi:hypothetical protein